VPLGLFILSNNLAEAFASTKTCRAIVVVLRDAGIGIVQNRTAEVGVLATV
jgi:hypothetical protein